MIKNNIKNNTKTDIKDTKTDSKDTKTDSKDTKTDIKDTKNKKILKSQKKIKNIKGKNDLKENDLREIVIKEDGIDEEKFFEEESYTLISSKLNTKILNPKKHNINMSKEDVIIPKDYRKTSEQMTIYEYTRVVSERAKQIENGSIIFIDYGNESNPIEIAKMEIRQKKCPLKIYRPYNTYIKEEWEVNEMVLPFI